VGFFQTVSASKKQKRIPFLKNEPEKLLKTKDRGQKTNRTEPENEAEKLLKTRSCGKSEPKTNRKTNWAILLETKNSEKRAEKRTGAFPAGTMPQVKSLRSGWHAQKIREVPIFSAHCESNPTGSSAVVNQFGCCFCGTAILAVSFDEITGGDVRATNQADLRLRRPYLDAPDEGH